jgi:hypothetical protein
MREFPRSQANPKCRKSVTRLTKARGFHHGEGITYATIKVHRIDRSFRRAEARLKPRASTRDRSTPLLMNNAGARG